jgi:hypothetical protein
MGAGESTMLDMVVRTLKAEQDGGEEVGRPPEKSLGVREKK